MKSTKFSKPRNKHKLPFVVRRVVGRSMVPALLPGALVVARVWSRQPKVGDVVIIFHDGKEKIKRISDIRGSEVYVLGDDLESSTDSRHFGWLDVNQVRARVLWPRTKK